MKTQNQIPMWPLYAADAIILLTALLIALPNAIAGVRMTGGQTALCFFMTLAAMIMVVLPYVLQHSAANKAAELSARRESENTKEQLEIIFDDLGALRNMIADDRENFDNIEDSLSKVAEKFSQVSSQIKTVSEGCAQTSEESAATKASLNASISKIRTAMQEDFDALKGEFLRATEKLSRKADAAEALAAEVKNLKSSLKADQENAAQTPLKSAPKPKETALLNKALVSAKSNFENSAVSKIISQSNGAKPQQFDDASESKHEEFSLKIEADFAQEEAELEADDAEDELDAHPEELAAANEDFADFEGDKKKESLNLEAQINPLPETAVSKDAGLKDKPELEALTMPAGDAPEDEPTEAEAEAPVKEADLFAEVKTAPKPKAAKRGQTAIIVNALIGIGNKPFLRGSGGGLNTEKGVQMDFLEIGKWQWICRDDISAPISVRVFINDEHPIGSSEYSLYPNEKLEVNLVYNNA